MDFPIHHLMYACYTILCWPVSLPFQQQYTYCPKSLVKLYQKLKENNQTSFSDCLYILDLIIYRVWEYWHTNIPVRESMMNFFIIFKLHYVSMLQKCIGL